MESDRQRGERIDMNPTISSIQPESLVSPISTVPDEILSLIFSNVWFYRDNYRRVRMRSERDVQSVSLTCRRWRAVSLGYPDFWADVEIPIPTSDPNPYPYLVRIQNLSERSGSAPLRVLVDCDERFEDFDASSKTAVSYLPRIRTLTLAEYDEYLSDDTLEAWVEHLSRAGRATSLEHLHMLSDKSARGGLWCRARPRHAIDAPLLQTLTLQCVYLPPSSPLFNNLRGLVLDNVGNEYSLSDLLRIFSCSPTLENLAFQSQTIVSGRTSAQVVLPRLARLELNYLDEQQPGLLLQHLALPSSTYILTESLYGDDDALPLPPQKDAAIGALGDIRHFEFHVESNKHAHCTDLAWEKMPCHVSSEARFRISLKYFNFGYRTALTAFVKWLSGDAHKLETLFITNHPRMDASYWTDVLRPMTGLRELRLIMDADAAVIPLDVISNASTTFLPSLTSLEVAEFSRSRPSQPHTLETAPPCPTFWASLRRFVEGRRARNISVTLVDVPCAPEDVKTKLEIAAMVGRFRFFELPVSESTVVGPTGLTRSELAKEARGSGGYGMLFDRLRIQPWDRTV